VNKRARKENVVLNCSVGCWSD